MKPRAKRPWEDRSEADEPTDEEDTLDGDLSSDDEQEAPVDPEEAEPETAERFDETVNLPT